MFNLFESIPVHMDFEGQKKAEKIFQILITFFAIIGFGSGFYLERLSISIYTLSVGFILASLITIPPWPLYRKNPLNWQPVEKENNENN